MSKQKNKMQPLNPNTTLTREDIDQLISVSDPITVRNALVNFWLQKSDAASASFVVARFEKLRGHVPLVGCRLAILRSFTIEPVLPLLRAMAFVAGIDLTVQLGDFDVYTQEILDPKSSLYAFKPDAVILAAHTADTTPDLWENFADQSPTSVQAAIERVSKHFDHLISVFRSNSSAHLILHSLQLPCQTATGILDSFSVPSQRNAIESINNAFGKKASETNNVYILDNNAMIARRGEVQWEDRRKWLSVRMPISAGELIHLAAEWMRFIHPITGKVCKAIAIDLDNTLWGGVIGEDGIEGIKVGSDYKGGAWRDVQRALLDLYHRGIILTLCSKNNPNEAMEAIEKHPGMLLRASHFSAVRINWIDKATNIRDIAKELNIGVDAVAFLDDNPVERDWVRRNLPDVTVIALPHDPMGFASALRDCPVFERLALSVEDRERGKMYAEQRLRNELQQSAGSIEDFYRSLKMKVSISPVNSLSIGRAAQLTQKTNQFNLTTRRYTEEQVSAMLQSPHYAVLTIRVVDRFGDNGIVGLAMTKTTGDVCEIDNFLLSCRVIGRTIETAFLATIAHAAQKSGATKLVGQFVPSKKNAPAVEFYAAHGFIKTHECDVGSNWALPLPNKELSIPTWIEIISDEK